jgi:hypothetical protein
MNTTTTQTIIVARFVGGETHRIPCRDDVEAFVKMTWLRNTPDYRDAQFSIEYK